MTHEEMILQTEYCPRFDELRKNRMVVSFYKYGPLIDNYKNEKCMDVLVILKQELKLMKTGNTEFLVDAANFCMIEFYVHTNIYFEEQIQCCTQSDLVLMK